MKKWVLAAHAESSSSLKPGHARPNPTALSHHSHGRSTHKRMRSAMTWRGFTKRHPMWFHASIIRTPQVRTTTAQQHRDASGSRWLPLWACCSAHSSACSSKPGLIASLPRTGTSSSEARLEGWVRTLCAGQHPDQMQSPQGRACLATTLLESDGLYA